MWWTPRLTQRRSPTVQTTLWCWRTVLPHRVKTVWRIQGELIHLQKKKIRRKMICRQTWIKQKSVRRSSQGTAWQTDKGKRLLESLADNSVCEVLASLVVPFSPPWPSLSRPNIYNMCNGSRDILHVTQTKELTHKKNIFLLFKGVFFHNILKVYIKSLLIGIFSFKKLVYIKRYTSTNILCASFL